MQRCVIAEDSEQMVTSERNSKEHSPLCDKAQSRWTNYTPHDLKRRVTRKLRHSEKNAAQEEYYRRKRELLEKSVEEEISERRKKMEREEEEHKLKMQLLKYEIEIKKIQFPQLETLK